MVVGISQKDDLILTAYKPLIWRGMLWHTGTYISNKEIFRRNRIEVNGVMINNLSIPKAGGIADLGSSTAVGMSGGVWFQEDNYLYVRLRSSGEQGAFCSSQDWMFSVKARVFWRYFTNKEFNVEGGEQIKYAVVSKYKIKQSAELDDYSTFKFNTVNVELIAKFVGLDVKTILGQLIRIRSDDLRTDYESQYIEDISFDETIVKLSCKDIRSRMTDIVIDQQYNENDYKNSSGNIVIDKDVLKRYKADAAGYCECVPGDCVNGYAFTTVPHRKYRFGYGKIIIDYNYINNSPELNRGVEVEIENGWRVMQKGSAGQTDRWWEEETEETLPSGITIKTTLICVPNLVAHPPKEGGFNVPDLDTTPRKLRVTGTFHAEIPDITRPYEIMKYIIDRYGLMSFNDANFDVTGIRDELDKIKDAPVGIFLNKPAKLFNVIGMLQNGGISGFQLYQEKGKIAARLNDPGRAPWGKILYTDIMNIKDLKPGVDGRFYASSVSVKYAKNHSNDTYSEYINENDEIAIVNLRGVQKRKSIETLLKNIDDAKIRTENELRYSMDISHVITGINLRPSAANSEKFYTLRIYDYVEIDFGTLIKSKSGFWIITNIEIDMETHIVTISVKERL